MYSLQLTSYGGSLRYTVKYETDRTVPYQRHMYGVDVIIQVRLLRDGNTHTCKIHTCKTPFALPENCPFSVEWQYDYCEWQELSEGECSRGEISGAE